MSHSLVIITGGLSGIGRGLVEHYRKCAERIVIFDLPEASELNAEQSKILQEDHVDYISCNMGNNANVEKAVKQVCDAYGAPSLVVNCAGILRAGEFIDLSATDFTTSFQVNVFGSRHLAAACLPRMQARGHFALVASMAGTVGVFGYSAYGASKFAVLGFAQCLRAEYAGRGIQISAICPPEIDTPMVREEIKTMHPATRVLKDFAGRLTLEEALPQIISGLDKRTFMIIPGKMAKFTYWINRLTPHWLNHLVMDFLVKRSQP